MKATKWQRAVSLLLCLLMAMSFLTVTAPKAYAADDATATVQVDWPQLKSLKIKDGYFYDGITAAASTFACKVKDIEITNYESIHTNEEGLAGTKVIGEVCITVMDPVKVENGTLTKTSADYPDELRVAKKGYSGETTVTGASLYVKNILYAKRVTGETYYGDGVGILPTIRIDNGTQKYYYYHLKIVPVTETAENTPPTIKEGVENPVTIDVTVNTAWQLDLTSIFEDADKDTLTYYVKIGDAEAVATGANYSYRPEAAGMTTLVFTAYDGKAYSQEYKATLNATAGETQSYEITTTAEGTYSLYESSKSAPMGSVEVEVNGTPSNKAKTGDTVVVKAVSQKFGVGDNNFYDAKLDKWEVTGIPGLSDSKLKEARLEFTMPNNDVSLKAVFVKAGSAVTLTANFPVASDLLLTVSGITIAATYDVNSGKQHKFDSVADTVAIGTEVSATIAPVSNPKTGNKLVGWEITNTTKEETVSVEYKDYPTQIGTIQRPYFTVDGTSNYTIKAIFAAKDYGNVNVTVNDEIMGTATAQIDTEEAATSLIGVVEGTTVKVQAQPKPGFIFQSWSATYGDGKTVETNDSSAAQTTFVMPATKHEAVNVVATFTEDPNYLSEECDLEEVALLDANGSPVGEYDQDGTVFTITLPADMDTTNLANMILKLTYSKNAQVFKKGSKTAWDANGQACNMTLGTATKFIVRSQKDLAEGDEGPTQEYTITIQQAAAPGTPTLSNGSATRSSKTAATVTFTTNEAGTYFYKVVTHGATAPTVEEIKKSTTKGTASAGETTFTLSNLTTDARDVYIVVVSAAGSESAPLKVEIPAYDSGSDTPSTGAYKISVTTPKGGTITTNRTKADAGDEIIVTVIPDDGYQMEADSLTYTLAKDKGETVKITGNKFTMPACDVTITCKWETATTTAKGITSFSINGVAGAVNNTTNTITITMPRGTDVTKLAPVIATNGVKSLTPSSGETVNFTNAVTYTATMEDGSSKTYTVTVYVDKGTLADQFWDKLTDFATQVPWWQYAEKQQSTSKYPKYW